MKIDTRKIKILIVDDHALLRDCLKTVLQMKDNIQVIAEAVNGEDAVILSVRLKPDIVIMDINLPGINGIEAVRKIKAENSRIKILMLSQHDEEDIIKESICAGADGYMFKMSDIDKLFRIIELIFSGEKYFENIIPEIINRPEEKSQSSKGNYYSEETDVLTMRQKEILKLVAKGLTSYEIGEKLFISYFTVGEHRKNILKKLELKNTAELISFAAQKGFI